MTLIDDFEVVKGHAVAFGYTVGIKAEDLGFDGFELYSLPNGVVDNV